MVIENPEAYVAGQWNWAILDGCFGNTKISPTDIDGFVERKGHFLVLEAKGPTAKLTQGQKWTYERLVEDPRFTVIIIWGDTNRPRKLLVMHGNTRKEYNPADLETLRERVASWFKWVERGPF